MTGTFHIPVRKSLVFAALCAGAAVGVARADDSSLNPFTGESYAAFSGGYDRPAISNPSVDRTPSTWRQSNPGGISERRLQAYSSPGEVGGGSLQADSSQWPGRARASGALVGRRGVADARDARNGDACGRRSEGSGASPRRAAPLEDRRAVPSCKQDTVTQGARRTVGCPPVFRCSLLRTPTAHWLLDRSVVLSQYRVIHFRDESAPGRR